MSADVMFFVQSLTSSTEQDTKYEQLSENKKKKKLLDCYSSYHPVQQGNWLGKLKWNPKISNAP